MMTINNKTILFNDIDDTLLTKTPFSNKGIKNVFKSMASEFLSNATNFLVQIQTDNVEFEKKPDKVFHITTQKSDDTIVVELKDIYEADFFINSGLVTRNITRKNISQLN